MNYFNEQEAIENNAKYHKTCHICGKEFWSTARQSKYCNDECAQKGLQKVNKRNKTRRIRRKAYDENKEINRALSKAYALAHDIADLYKIPKVCSCNEFGFDDECSGSLELHHRFGNPFDNRPQNLCWLCRHHHPMADALHENVNMVDTYNEAVDAAGFEEEDEKYKVMIKYTRDKIGE